MNTGALFIGLHHLADLFEQMPDYAAFTLDRDGYIISRSIRASILFGETRVDLTKKSCTDLYRDPELVLSFNEAVVSNPLKPFTLEGWHRKNDNSVFFGKSIYSPVYCQNGQMNGFLLVVKDTTADMQASKDRRFTQRLEQEVAKRTWELKLANQELEAFSYSVSHDLRAPLRAVNGFSQILLEKYKDGLGAEGARLLNIIYENGKLMGELIDDLLKFARLSKLEVKDKAMDMKSAVDEALSLLNVDSTSQRKIKINALLPCFGDAHMLRQVWVNLIDNALKYSSKVDFPIIEIGCNDNTGSITYYIKDNGAGFDMKYADKLFNIFQRLHSNDQFAGTGLGLALVKRIINKHGGEVSANSTVGEGSEFKFTLPKLNNERTS